MNINNHFVQNQSFQTSFKGNKLFSIESKKDFLKKLDRNIHLNDREKEVLAKLQQLEVEYYAQNGFHIPMIKEHIDLALEQSGALPCDAELVFDAMKALSDFDKLSKMADDKQKVLDKVASQADMSEKERKAKKQEFLTAVQQNLIRLTPPAVMKEFDAEV